MKCFAILGDMRILCVGVGVFCVSVRPSVCPRPIPIKYSVHDVFFCVKSNSIEWIHFALM